MVQKTFAWWYTTLFCIHRRLFNKFWKNPKYFLQWLLCILECTGRLIFHAQMVSPKGQTGHAPLALASLSQSVMYYWSENLGLCWNLSCHSKSNVIILGWVNLWYHMKSNNTCFDSEFTFQRQHKEKLTSHQNRDTLKRNANRVPICPCDRSTINHPCNAPTDFCCVKITS